MAITVGVLTVCLTSPKSNKPCQTTFRRAMKSSIISNSHPRSLTIGDVNNDHHSDILVANSGTDEIGILLANGDGTFQKQQTFPTRSQSRPYSVVYRNFSWVWQNGTFREQPLFSLGSSHPLFLSIADLNSDNRTDLLVANYGTDSISILLGYGNGSFQNQIIYSTGYDSHPYSIGVGDFNQDHCLDLAVANYGTNNIGIFLGYGNGTFSNQITYTTTHQSNPSSLVIADFNHDHHLDIAVSNNGTSKIGIFLGNGDGTFLPQITYSIRSTSHPQHIAIGHFDKDNIVDLAIIDSTNDHIHILRGYGNGSFSTLTTYDTNSGSNPIWMSVVDLNNNNQSDLVVANYGSNNILILIDYFFEPSARQTNYNPGQQPVSGKIAVSDFNNDSILDIVYSPGGTFFIVTGFRNGSFDQNTTYSIGSTSASQYIGIGDLNNDHRMDIISANTWDGCVNIFLGYDNGSFSTKMNYSTGIGSQPMWVALGDLNHDNILDIVSANSGSLTIGILLGYGDGSFATVMTLSTIYHSPPNSVAVGNIDNDNHLDIVVSDTLNDNIDVLLGSDDGTFSTLITYSTGSASLPYYVIVDDFNNDNISDIAATNYGTNEVVIFYGYGNGSFHRARTFSTGIDSKPYGIAAADFDNDQQLEIVVQLWGTGKMAILTEYMAAKFINQAIYATGSALHPVSIVIGDLNEDNRSDVVITYAGTDSLHVLLGSNNGTFNTKMPYLLNTNSRPQYVMTCDINKDHHLDIVSVNSKSDSISVIMGYGNNTFADEIIYSTGNSSHPLSAVAGDINNDNRLDLVIANEGTDEIGIFFGHDYASFHDQVIYSGMGNEYPIKMVVSDFNNDTYLDIAVVFSNSDSFGILFGHGNGSFTNIVTYSTGHGSFPFGIAAEDLNNDTCFDIVVTNSLNDSIGVFIGYGNGSFAPMITYSTGNTSTPADIVVGDCNNDHRLDVIVVNYAADNIGLFLGYGNGTFSSMKTSSVGKGFFPRSICIGDFNNDTYLDIAVASSDSSRIAVLLGYGDGTYRNQWTWSLHDDMNLNWINVGDFNRDNQLDIATANGNYNSVGILLGYGNGTFTDTRYYSTGTGSAPLCISVDDFNNDNLLNIAVAKYGTNEIVVLFGLGDGNFLLGKSYSTGLRSLPDRLAIGDFDNDSRLDIAVAHLQSNNIGIFLRYDTEPFGSMIPVPSYDRSQPHSVAVRDIDNDGWLDIVMANYGIDSVGIFSKFTFPPGQFKMVRQYPMTNGSKPYSIAVDDLNNDTHLDIVVINSETDNINILLGDGNGTFVFSKTYSTGTRSRPYALTVADFNNDHLLDIAIANSGTSSILLLYDKENGTFEPQPPYPLGYGYHPYSIAVDDLNHDDRMDIVIACYDTDQLETLIQTCE